MHNAWQYGYQLSSPTDSTYTFRMNALVFVALFAAIAAAHAGFLPAPAAYVAGPAFAPAAYAAPAFAAPAAAFAAPAAYAAPLAVIPPGSGLEGQYIPDNLEKLYDDGSYKPFLYP